MLAMALVPKAVNRAGLFAGFCLLALAPASAQSEGFDFRIVPANQDREVVSIYEERIYKISADMGTNQIRFSEITVNCSKSVLLTEREIVFNENNPYLKRKLFGDQFDQQVLEPDQRSVRSLRTEFDIWPTNQANVSIQDLVKAPVLFHRVFRDMLDMTNKVIHSDDGHLSIGGRYKDPSGPPYDVSFTYDLDNRRLVELHVQFGRQSGTAFFNFLGKSNNIPIFSAINYEIRTDGALDFLGILKLKFAYETNRSPESSFLPIPVGSVVRNYTSGTLKLSRPTFSIATFDSLQGASGIPLEPLGANKNSHPQGRRVVVIALMITVALAPVFLFKNSLLRKVR